MTQMTSAFDIAQLPAGVVPLDWKAGDPIKVVISHGLTEVQLATKSIKFDPDQIFLQDVLAGLTQCIIRTAKLGCQFKDVYPIVQSYVATRFFGSTQGKEQSNPRFTESYAGQIKDKNDGQCAVSEEAGESG
jgi:hypothetical protein